MTEQIYVVFSFHDSSTQSERDADIAYLNQYLEPLVNKISAIKSYEIAQESEMDPELELLLRLCITLALEAGGIDHGHGSAQGELNRRTGRRYTARHWLTILEPYCTEQS